MDFSTVVKNAAGNAIETAIGPSPILRIRSGAKPANCEAADTGTVLATMNLPVDWMADAANAVKALLGVWQDTAADAAGIAGHFRIYASDGTTCGIQGTCGETGSGADMILQNTDINVGQEINVVSFNINLG